MPLAAVLVARDHAIPKPAPVRRVSLLASKRDYSSGRGNLANFVALPANTKKWGDVRSVDGWKKETGAVKRLRLSQSLMSCLVLL